MSGMCMQPAKHAGRGEYPSIIIVIVVINL